MKRKPQSYQATPQPVDAPSGQVAKDIGLPWKQVAMPKLVLGRREWIGLPEFGVGPLNAKIDTGARTSSLHAEQIQVTPDGQHVFFVTRDYYGRPVTCEAAVHRLGRVKSSTGVAGQRFFIETDAILAGGFVWRIRLTLANRAEMRCPMLLGRQALAGYFLIDPQGNHLKGALRELEAHFPDCRRP